MDELAIKIEHVSKQYRLGTIGGGTLQEDLQSWWALKHGKEDPNSKIGSTKHLKRGERFLALDDINLEVKKGEALGIIGPNGAGKSTLLKLLSRVTAPTEGTISYNGRITSMLEVGTGFHRELTGRENIYMNGAILGMSKKEVAEKIEQIIDFSEVREFIDTPVKRYSSGMYVKLAFSVAAHLDSEIMIMDEVLAVGDMDFQHKCLDKMRAVAEQVEGRTVLYVSHNMNTIRQLCDRCIVLDHGKIIFDGDVEEAIGVYMGVDIQHRTNDIEVTPVMHELSNPSCRINHIHVNSDNNIEYGGRVSFSVHIENTNANDKNVFFRVLLKTVEGKSVSMAPCSHSICIHGKETIKLSYNLDVSHVVPGQYALSFVVYEIGHYGVDRNIDVIRDIYQFSIMPSLGFNHDMPWNPYWWGNISIGELIEE